MQIKSTLGKIVITLCLFIGVSCNGWEKTETIKVNQNLDFVENIDPNDVFSRAIRDSLLISYVAESDFLIVFQTLSQIGLKDYSFFVAKGNNALLYRVRDFVRSKEDPNKIVSYFTEDIIESRTLSFLKSLEFIDQLQSYGAFTLREAKDLLRECESPIAFDHPPYYVLTIYKNCQARKIYYQDVEKRKEICPQVSDWSRMSKIKELFKEQWEQ